MQNSQATQVFVKSPVSFDSCPRIESISHAFEAVRSNMPAWLQRQETPTHDLNSFNLTPCTTNLTKVNVSLKESVS